MAKRGDPRLTRDYKAFRLKVLARDQWSCFYCQQPSTTKVSFYVIFFYSFHDSIIIIKI